MSNAADPKTISLFRKMSVVEAEMTLATLSVQPAIEGAHPIKHFSTFLEKVRAFRNKAVTVPETIVEFQVDAARSRELQQDAVPQKGASRFPDRVQISMEGLTTEAIAAGHINVGIPPGLLEVFNNAILVVKEVTDAQEL